MISDTELINHHQMTAQLLNTTPPLKETFCDALLLPGKSYDIPSPSLDGSFSFMQPQSAWTSLNSTPTPSASTICYPPVQVMYGMMPYWMMSPTLTTPSNLLTPTASTNSTTSSVSASPAIVSRPHTEPLYEWMRNHEKDPYPTRREKEFLGRICGMTSRQIEHWFANARRRMKKMNNSKRLRSSLGSTEYGPEKDDDSTSLLTSSFSSSSSSEGDVIVRSSSSITEKLNSEPEIKKSKGIWSIISTLQ